jgi:hypothetical protein
MLELRELVERYGDVVTLAQALRLARSANG